MLLYMSFHWSDTFSSQAFPYGFRMTFVDNFYISSCVHLELDCVGLLDYCRYLSALISQSFLDIGSVSRILDSIIKLCLQLCRVIEQQDGTPGIADLEQITEVHYIADGTRHALFSRYISGNVSFP